MQTNPEEILSLSTESVRGHWLEADECILNILTVMDSAEDWVVDGHPAIEAEITRFCETLQNCDTPQKIGAMSDNMLFIMAYLHSGRAMRLLSWLDGRYPGMGLKLVQAASDAVARGYESGEVSGTEALLMVERLQMLKRMKHLSRIFSPSRIRFVIKALERSNQS